MTATSTSKRTEYSAADVAPDFPLGTRVESRGVTYTRISRLGRADWVTTSGAQFYRLPVTEFRVIREPEKDDLEAAFNATPVLSGDDRGFGVVAARDLLEGDVVYNESFRMRTGTVEKIEEVSNAGHIAVTTVVGRHYVSPTVACVFRGGDPDKYFAGAPAEPAQPGVNASPDQVAAFVGNPHVGPKTLISVLNRLGAAGIDEKVAVAAAGNPSAPATLLRKLAKHPSLRVRQTVLASPAKTASVVKGLISATEAQTKTDGDTASAEFLTAARDALATLATRKRANKP